MTLVKIDSYTGSDIVGDVLLRYLLRQRCHRPGFLRSDDLAGYDVLHKQAIVTLSIAGTSFQLHKGPHGGHGASTIFTFVANSEQSSYNGNLLDFYYLVDNGTGMKAFTANNINFPTNKYLYHVYQPD